MAEIEEICAYCDTKHKRKKWAKAIKVHTSGRNNWKLGESLVVPKERLKPWVPDALKDGKQVKICGLAYNVSS